MKKFFAHFLTVAFMLIFMGIFPSQNCVSAETFGDLTYTIINEEIAITSCSSLAEGSIRIPSTLEGYPVTRIYCDAFRNCTKLTNIYIPSSVTKIESGAFSSCRNLKGIWIDDNNPKYYSDQSGVLFNKEKTSLLRAPSTLSKYVVPNTVTHIESNAFNYCKSLSEVIIGESVSDIGADAFYECTNLVDIEIPDSVKTLGGGCFYGCSNLSSITIGKSVTDIGDYAFNFCDSLTEISLPDSVININRAFNLCANLTTVELGNGVKSISYRAFWNCDQLSNITIGSGVTRIGSCAFEGCDNLINVYYKGTEKQWKQVIISENNYLLTERATIHYIHIHIYDNACDTKCNECAETRNAEPHKYDNECDENCDICGASRQVSHKYDAATCSKPKTCNICGTTSGEKLGHSYTNACDTSCNRCSAIRTIKHSYTNSCDTNCNICNKARTISHKYSPATCTKPKTCTVCGVTNGKKLGHDYWIGYYADNNNHWHQCETCGHKKDLATHRFSNACDSSCNVCDVGRTIKHSYKTATTKATLTKNGSVVKKCSICGKVASKTAIKYVKSFKLSTTTYTYDGKVKTPSVTVKDSAGKTLKKNTDYTVTYASGRKNVGTFKVAIKMKAKYTGTKVLSFKINPPKTTVSKLTAGKKSITVAITKKSTQVTGYQIQYSTSKTFSKATTKTISSYKTTKYTLKSLSAKKTYYVRVRTYKTVGKTKYYSGWSTYKYVKTK